MVKNLSLPRVLQVLPALESGGVERVSVDMVAGIKKNYPNVKTFVASGGGVLVDKILLLGGQHFKVPLNLKTPWSLIGNALSLRKLIREHDIHLVHARSRGPAWSAFLAARKARIPFITTYHGIYNSRNALKSFYNSIMARGDYVIAISEYVANHIKQNYPHLSNNIRVIHEGIDTAYFNPDETSCDALKALQTKWGVPQGHKIILLPGRLTRWKGHEILIKALHKIDISNLYAIILGNDQGKDSYKLELECKSAGLPVKFMKECHDMQSAYALADVVLSCSTDPEAFGRVTAEALSMGSLYIGTDCGATPEMCVHEKTGFLVPPSNPDALAAMISHVLSLSEERKLSLSVCARQHICNNFSLDRMVKQTLDLYSEAVYGTASQ